MTKVTVTLPLILPRVTSSSLPQSQPLPPSLSHFGSLLETPTCVSCFGPSVFPPPQPDKLAYSHNMGHQVINYMRQAMASLKRRELSYLTKSL